MRDGATSPSLGLWIEVALKYLLVRGKGYSSLVAWVSIAGLTLGVAALVAVISVMNGLGSEIESRVLGNLAHVFVQREPEQISAQQFDERIAAIKRNPQVQAGFEFIEAGGVVSLGSGVHPILVYAAGEDGLPWLPDFQPSGELEGLVLGSSLADYFAVRLGDYLRIVLVGSQGKTQALRERVTGIFETRSDLDYSLVFLPLERFSGLANIGRKGVRLVVEDPLQTPALIQDWTSQGMLDGLRVEDWTATQGELVRVLGMERVIMFSLLMMIVVIAALNLVAGQAMLVSEKQSEIAILQTMGAGGGLIERTFLAYGGLVALFGTFLGLAVGVVLATQSNQILQWIRDLLGVDVLAGSWFQSLPYQVRATDLVTIGGLSLLISLFACILPARRASRLSPADHLG